MPPALIKATYNDNTGISHFNDSLSSLSNEIQYRSATNLAEDVAILLSFKFCRLLFSSFKGKVQNVSANQKLVFQPARKTNLVENVETLLPVKFRLIPLSGFREEIS